MTGMAESGATEQQMQAVSGHKGSRELQPYLQKARRKGLAEDAMRLLDRGPAGGETRTAIGPPSKKVSQ